MNKSLNIILSSHILLVLFTGNALSASQEQHKMQLETMVVTATRSEKPLSNVPYSASVVELDNNKNQTVFRTVPEALRYEPGIMIQKTGHGQGSPYIRGFTGFRTLLLVDGIRLNNSVFRDGPNQYMNTVDPFSIASMEVVRGPSSALYGSDAIGGTINMISRGNSSTETGFNLHPSVFYRVSDAENSHSGHAETSVNYDDALGLLFGFSYKSYGNLVGGNQVGLQPQTGYDDLGVNFKADYELTRDSQLTFAHQHFRLDDAWRTHATRFGTAWKGSAVGSDKKRILDQQRELSYVRYQGMNFDMSVVDTLTATFSFQQQDEKEYRVRSNNRSNRQGFEVDTVGFTVQADKSTEFGRWTYGIEYYHDAVESFNTTFNPNGSINKIEIQGPVADDSFYTLFDVYVQNEYTLVDSLDMVLGGRYTHAAVDARKIGDPITGDSASFSSDWNNLAGSARFMFHFDEDKHWNLFTGISQGFRAPNLSDLTRLDTALSGELETSTKALEPEQYISYEIGLKTDYDNGDAQLAYFYTDIEDMIVRTPTGRTVDGQAEVTKRNASSGFIHGIEFSGSYRILPELTAFTTASWTEGHVQGYPTSSPVSVNESITRMMPVTANFGLRWESFSNWWAEGLITVAAGQYRLSSSDRRDTQRIPPGGTPGYSIYNIRGGWTVSKHVDLTLALENITDKDYRIHGSGLNEPGRNFILGVGVKF